MKKAISIYPILLVHFIGTLGFSLVLPFLVFLVTKFGGNAQIYGVLGATYPAFQLIGAPILGKWSDIYGRRRVLLLSQAGTLLSWLIFLAALLLPIHTMTTVDSKTLGQFTLTVPLLILFLARALDGLTGGNISVANAYMADITEDEDRSQNFGKMAIASNLGFIIGPTLAGLLGGTVLQETLPVLAAAGISLTATLVIAFHLPESRPCVMQQSPEPSPVRKVFGQENKDCFDLEGAGDVSLKQVLSLRNIPYLLMLYFFIFLGFTFFYTAFPIHVAQELNWSIGQLGIFFSFLSGLMILVQGPVLSRLTKRFSDARMIIVGNLILGTNFILMTSSEILLIYLAAVFFAFGNGLMWPSVLSMLSKVAGDKYQGSVQGFAGSFGSLASIFGLIIGGVLYGAVGATTFLVSAVIIYLIFLLSFRLVKIERELS
ncbi:MFS transporter [bacterium]|nr:MFS transporter [bacterium]